MENTSISSDLNINFSDLNIKLSICIYVFNKQIDIDLKDPNFNFAQLFFISINYFKSITTDNTNIKNQFVFHLF